LNKLALTNLYELFDLSIFLGLILLMIVVLLNRKGFRSFQSKLFNRMVLSIIVLLFLDVLLWLLNGKSRWGLHVLTIVYYIAETPPLVLWLCYVDYSIYHSLQRLRKRWFYIQPIILIVLILTVSAPFGFVYSLDENMDYVRGPGVALILLVNAALLVWSMAMAWLRRKDLGNRALLVISTFGILPIIGSIAQVVMYRTTVLWPSVALAAIFAYLYLENHREIRDYLTGLYNRQQIDDLVQFRILEYKKRGSFSLVMIDMDGFKDINDRFGHKEGDRALVTMASILMGAVRSVDSVGRFGGDEFMILMEENDTDHTTLVINRIKAQLDELNDRTSQSYRLEFSCGTTSFSPEKHRNIDDLHREVDTKMYAEKNKKKETRG
jgi:diguanylate cyclase (GGDEF)-like protein